MPHRSADAIASSWRRAVQAQISQFAGLPSSGPGPGDGRPPAADGAKRRLSHYIIRNGYVNDDVPAKVLDSARATTFRGGFSLARSGGRGTPVKGSR